MSHWSAGETRYSPIYHAHFYCSRRWFAVGRVEMVELRQVVPVLAGDGLAPPFIRTARAMSAPLFPGVVGRGGVTTPEHCARVFGLDHGHGPIVEDGRSYCGLCGGEAADAPR